MSAKIECKHGIIVESVIDSEDWFDAYRPCVEEEAYEALVKIKVPRMAMLKMQSYEFRLHVAWVVESITGDIAMGMLDEIAGEPGVDC